MQEENHLGQGRLEELKKTARFSLLIGVWKSSQDKEKAHDHLQELQRLCDTYGMQVTQKHLLPLRQITAATYIGSGKAQEIAQICVEENIDIVIFDEEISPQQQRNLEKIFERPVIDRTELILGVFAKRAKTKEAKIQIDLAYFRYQLPRLKRMWTHLSRQRIGGASGGYLKGMGERQIEIDRRLLKDKIAYLEKKLQEIRKQRQIQRKARQRSHIPTFAIIGYTNAGKSTLLNALTKAEVFIEDKLFATLDTTTRKFILPNHQQILLVDTVGFIRKIPHTLIAAFKSTLEETLYTDILLHLIDVANPNAEEQAEAALEVLQELNITNKPIITVLNKIDAAAEQKLALRLKMKYPKSVIISAKNKQGFDQLLSLMMKEISLLRKVVKLKIPQSHYHIVSQLMKHAKVLSCEYEGNNILLQVEIPHEMETIVEPFYIS